ncbi:hypothetical protein [Azospirillum sp. TSO35-2]|uniref:hypothetical protein n=1 Tax=Azospirillum sp. TSO35-2 TaxID=716796 RepID=UPI0013048D33|nr:hypothetical protein [Azospirillum sp. TSO35-2]
MKTDHSDHRPSGTAGQGHDDDWVGAYGFGGHHGPGYDPQPGETRDAWDRAADSFLASIGDEDAARRLRNDYMLARAGRGRDRSQ